MRAGPHPRRSVQNRRAQSATQSVSGNRNGPAQACMVPALRLGCVSCFRSAPLRREAERWSGTAAITTGPKPRRSHRPSGTPPWRSKPAPKVFVLHAIVCGIFSWRITKVSLSVWRCMQPGHVCATVLKARDNMDSVVSCGRDRVLTNSRATKLLQRCSNNTCSRRGARAQILG